MKYKKRLFNVTNVKIKESIFEQNAYKKLLRKYSYALEKKSETKEQSQYNKTIWVCWFQGIDNAPLLVKKCYNRLLEVFGSDRVVLLTQDNFFDYVDIPDFIIKKWEKGIITYAHFSDVLRIFLLSKHGGTWIDSTVYIMRKNIPNYFMESELFAFENRGSNDAINISSWFISAYSHNVIIEAVKELLIEYWKHENYIMHYFLVHIFFKIASERYNDEWGRVPKFSNMQPHILVRELFNQYDAIREEQICNLCPIQKLSYKKIVPTDISNTFYEKYIIK